MRKTFVLLVSLALILLSVGPMAASARQNGQQKLPDLFTEPANLLMARDAQTFTDEVIRHRQVDVNTSILVDLARSSANTGFSEQSAFMLNLFDDAVYLASVDSIEPFTDGSYGLVGHVNSEDYNELILLVQDDILQGYLQVGLQSFEVRYENGLHTIREVDNTAYPDSLAETAPQPDPLVRESQPDNLSAVGDLPPSNEDSGGIIDVLAVYTPAARSALGSTATIETRIQQSILSANSGYSNSGITQQLRLVGMEEVSYTEEIAGATNSQEWYAALYRMTFGYYSGVGDSASANYLADVRAYRDSYKADLVFMVSALPYVYCGLGWIAGDSWGASYGYSVVHYNCTGSTSYSVQHEMGHNMGACHDRANSSFSCMYDYSYGYQQPDHFYTVMAYASGCGSCSRINRWSNPDLTYEGYSTGVAIDNSNSAHNVLALNNTAHNVANYRQSGNPIYGAFSAPLSSQIMIPRGYVDIDVASLSGSITQITYQVFYNSSWHSFVDSNSADGWGYTFPTAGVSDPTLSFRALVEDSIGNTNTIPLSNIPISRTYTFGNGYESRSDDMRTDGSVPQPEDLFIEPPNDTNQLPVMTSPWHTLPH